MASPNAVVWRASLNMWAQGKQARRTRSSSPLGQLFDHGCDALSVHLLVGNVQVSVGQGHEMTGGAGARLCWGHSVCSRLWQRGVGGQGALWCWQTVERGADPLGAPRTLQRIQHWCRQ